jgi:hypothetical protein
LWLCQDTHREESPECFAAYGSTYVWLAKPEVPHEEM